MIKDLLLKHFPEDKVEKILKIESNGVTFDMLSNGQKKVFIGIAKLIEQHMAPNKPIAQKTTNEDVMDLFGYAKKHVTLNGPAGTGKTTLMKFITSYIRISGFINQTKLCAPNHNARKVLTSYTGLQASTIHSLLKIKPDNYELERSFSRSLDDKGANPLAGCKILIVDEISFIDELLFEILMRELPHDCIVVGLGNIDQLKPIPPKNAVDANGVRKQYTAKVSPFFDDRRFYKLELTEIRRSDNPVATVGESIRLQNIKFPENDSLDEHGNGVHVTYDMREFLTSYFEHVKTPDDFKNNRVVAFANDDVDTLNKRIRQKIYNTSEQLVIGEILVAQAPYFETDDPIVYSQNKMPTELMLCQNGTFLEVVSVEPYSDTFQVENLPPVDIRGYEVKVKELDVFFDEEIAEDGKGRVFTVNILQEESKNAYAKFLETYVQELLNQRARKERVNWRQYYLYADKMFLDYKYLPACTIHKSQGITVDNVFYYVDFVKTLPDQDFARRLTYVAVTRARYNSFLLY